MQAVVAEALIFVPLLYIADAKAPGAIDSATLVTALGAGGGYAEYCVVPETNALPVPPGPALVRRGYAVLAIDAYCFGERTGQGPGGPRELGYQFTWFFYCSRRLNTRYVGVGQRANH